MVAGAIVGGLLLFLADGDEELLEAAFGRHRQSAAEVRQSRPSQDGVDPTNGSRKDSNRRANPGTRAARRFTGKDPGGLFIVIHVYAYAIARIRISSDWLGKYNRVKRALRPAARRRGGT